MNNKFNQLTHQMLYGIFTILIITNCCPPDFAQEEPISAPLPGGSTSPVGTNSLEKSNNIETRASTSISNSSVTSPELIEKAEALSAAANMSEDDLPVSLDGLRTLISKYQEETKDTKSDELKLNSLLGWLDGLIKSHNKLANAFVKQENLKIDFDSECSLVRELHEMKDEVLYLKAQELIQRKKLKQAIPILIEIVSTEPSSALGQTAYQHLKFSGFSVQHNPNTAKTISKKPISNDTALLDKKKNNSNNSSKKN